MLISFVAFDCGLVAVAAAWVGVLAWASWPELVPFPFSHQKISTARTRRGLILRSPTKSKQYVNESLLVK
jgi:hypothetical protein